MGPIFIIGGQRLFNEAIQSRWCHSVYLTTVCLKSTEDVDSIDIKCDTFWSGITDDYSLSQRVSHYKSPFLSQDNFFYDVTTNIYTHNDPLEHPESGYVTSLL